MEFDVNIGLEVHVELSTDTKMYCGCSTKFGDEPNSHVCPVCLGLPGSLPRLNKKAVEYAIKAGIALNCSINSKSRMDRKNYFYPDCPKNYQITQWEIPLCRDGYIEIEHGNGKVKRIGIERIHIEEDAAKLVHTPSGTFIDYNRAGIPLIEIVSKPDINSPKEATEYLEKLRSILRFIGVSDCRMEQGSLRCDGNISVKMKDSSILGVKTEIKNVNSFKALEKAFVYECNRHIDLIENGCEIQQETRRWNNDKSCTIAMRSKEHSNDYRYFPEGDLVIINIFSEEIEKIRRSIPELPHEKAARFVENYGITLREASVISEYKHLSAFFEDTVRICNNPIEAIKWIAGDILRFAKEKQILIENLKITPDSLSRLIALIDCGTISKNIGKIIIEEMLNTGKDPDEIIHNRNLRQNNDEKYIENTVNMIFDKNPKCIEDYKHGKKRSAKFIIGLVMRETGGKANPKIVNKLVNQQLDNLLRKK